MRLIIKNPWGVILVSTGIFLLGACSSSSTAPIHPPTAVAHTPQSSKTPTAEILQTALPAPTKTNLTSPTETTVGKSTIAPTDAPTEELTDLVQANLLSVRVSGEQNAYQFAVEIRSPDTGCEQYADWWEVATEDGDLIYRRILAHSHVTEQPFTRSGGPVAISADTVVIVRAHMHPDGYGKSAFRGSVNNGFEAFQLDPSFAPDLEKTAPLPSGCGF